MKKVIALTLALALALTNGLISFAGTISLDVNDGAFTVGVTEVLVIENGIADMEISDVNGFMQFGQILKMTGSTDYVVEVTPKYPGVTKIVVTDINGYEIVSSSQVSISPNAEEDDDEGGMGQEQFVTGDVNLDGAVDIFDLIALAKIIVGA